MDTRSDTDYRTMEEESLSPEPNVVVHPSGEAVVTKEGTGSVMGGVMNLSNTILGSGTLGTCMYCPNAAGGRSLRAGAAAAAAQTVFYPRRPRPLSAAMALACRRCGVALFVLMLLFVATCAHRSIMLLMRVSERLQLRSCKYPDLGRRLFGTRGEYACALSVILQQTGACIAYVVIIADTLVPILKLGADTPSSLLCDRWPWQILIVGTVIFPLCLLRQMESLKYTSFVALAFILSFTLAVVGVGSYALRDNSWRMDRYLEHHHNGTAGVCTNRVKECAAVPTNHIAAFPDSLDVLNALPIICFAFLCHMNAFPIRNELKDPTLVRMGHVSLASMLVCASIYFLAGAFGYFAFTDSTLDNLMLNFVTSGNTLAFTMDVLRVGFGLALIFSFPVIIYEAREGIVHLFFQNSPAAHTSRFHFLLNLAMVSFACLIGILVPQIDTIFGIVGSTATPMIVFILPAALWLQVRPCRGYTQTARTRRSLTRPLQAQRLDGDPIMNWDNATPWMLLIFGLVLIPVALYSWAAATFSGPAAC